MRSQCKSQRQLHVQVLKRLLPCLHAAYFYIPISDTNAFKGEVHLGQA